MPQMSPMMWLTLFIFFSMSFILFNQMNFFSYKKNFHEQNMKKNYKNNNYWKW